MKRNFFLIITMAILGFIITISCQTGKPATGVKPKKPTTTTEKNATAVKTEKEATGGANTVKEEKKEVVINGVKWATRNVGAPGTFVAKPEDPGMFYQWNRKKGWSGTGEVAGWDNSVPKGDTWEKANDPCPPGWRLPTPAELHSLNDVESQWTTLNKVYGRKFGTGNNTMFLPAAGYRYSKDGTLFNIEVYGMYSSHKSSSATNIHGLKISSNSVTPIHEYSRALGYSVRCVAE